MDEIVMVSPAPKASGSDCNALMTSQLCGSYWSASMSHILSDPRCPATQVMGNAQFEKGGSSAGLSVQTLLSKVAGVVSVHNLVCILLMDHMPFVVQKSLGIEEEINENRSFGLS